MKNFILTIFSAFILVFSSSGKTLDMAIFYGIFNHPGESPYVETYFSLNPNSVQWMMEDGKYTGTVDIIIAIKKGDSLVSADHLQMTVPAVEDTNLLYNDLIQQTRFGLPNGEYSMNLTITDLGGKGKPYQLSQAFTVDIPKDKVSLSDVQFVDNYSKATEVTEYTKSGMTIVPIVPRGDYYLDENHSDLKFYFEIYNEDLDPSNFYVLKFYLEDLNDQRVLYSYGSSKKLENTLVTPILHSFDISKLKSGQYSLTVEVISSKNQKVSQKRINFYRSNPEEDFKGFDLQSVSIDQVSFLDTWTLDSAKIYLECLYPIADYQERRISAQQVEEGDLDLMKRFFVSFWTRRGPENPYEAWEQYWKNVEYVDRQFGTVSFPGYRTDLGRVFLQYGPPSQIDRVDSDPRAYPYQIWQYNEINSASTSPQVNKIFIFVNFDIGSKYYELLHSDAREERFNPRWRMQLLQRDQSSLDPYETGINNRDYMGSKIQNNMIINSGNVQNTNRNYGTSGN